MTGLRNLRGYAPQKKPWREPGLFDVVNVVEISGARAAGSRCNGWDDLRGLFPPYLPKLLELLPGWAFLQIQIRVTVRSRDHG